MFALISFAGKCLLFANVLWKLVSNVFHNDVKCLFLIDNFAFLISCQKKTVLILNVSPNWWGAKWTFDLWSRWGDTFHTCAWSRWAFDLNFKSGVSTHLNPNAVEYTENLKVWLHWSSSQLTCDRTSHWTNSTLPHKSNSQIHNASNQGQFLVKKISIKLHNFWFRVCLFLIKHVDFTKACLCVNIWSHDAIVQRTFVSKTYRQMFTHVCKESMCN